jgi:hypothetical protein
LVISVVAARGQRSGARPRTGSGAVYNSPGWEPARADALASQLDDVARRLDAEEALGKRSIQRVGIVRYNPFEDTGSNQSFVLAMLDANGDGFVLSSLHSRQQTRVFLKQLVKGTADAALSQEENEAIRRATES